MYVLIGVGVGGKRQAEGGACTWLNGDRTMRAGAKRLPPYSKRNVRSVVFSFFAEEILYCTTFFEVLCLSRLRLPHVYFPREEVREREEGMQYQVSVLGEFRCMY